MFIEFNTLFFTYGIAIVKILISTSYHLIPSFDKCTLRMNAQKDDTQVYHVKSHLSEFCIYVHMTIEFRYDYQDLRKNINNI